MAALLLFLLLTGPARAETLRQACANEISLLCPQGADAELQECLAEYAGSATARCRAQIGGFKARGKTADVWGSAASARGGGIGLGFQAAVAPAPKDAPARGFELAVAEEPSYYHFAGRAPSDLAAGMGDSGITDGIDGTKGAASTGASLSGRYSAELKSEGCVLAGARLRLVVRQRLPYWDAPADAAPDTAAWWAKALGAIVKHEDGHKKIDLDSGRAALSSLQNLPPAPTCGELDAVVGAEMHRADVEAMQKNVAWDQQTGHGRTQYEEAFGKSAP